MNYIKPGKLFRFIMGLMLSVSASHAVNPLLTVNWSPPQWEADPEKNDTQNLLDLLAGLEAAAAENEWLWILELHFNSMQRLIQAYPPSAQQTTALINLFTNPDTGAGLSPYIRGDREFLIAYDSQAGGVLSYVRCTLPNNWDPNRRYPLYVWPRGGGSTPYPGDITDRYTDQINGVIIPGTPSAVYKDGFTIVPGGLGGRSYLNDNGGLDFVEGIDTFRSKFHTDPRRMYMGGFSNGGKGSYLIGANYMDKYRWAALGLCAPSLSEGTINTTFAAPLIDTPIWLAVGANDGLVTRARQARDMLIQLGNPAGYYSERAGTGHTWVWDFQLSMYDFMREHEYVYPGGPPPVPENLHATSVRDNGVTLEWSLPAGLEEAEIWLEWVVGSGQFSGRSPRAYLPPGTTSYSHDSLTANTLHKFRIRAYDKTGDSEISPVIEFTTGQNTAAAWAGYTIEEDGHVHTGDFLGSIYPYGDWVWIWLLEKFTFTPESHVTDEGAWSYILR